MKFCLNFILYCLAYVVYFNYCVSKSTNNFLREKTATSYSEVERICQNQNGHLAIIRSKILEENLKNLLQIDMKNYWRKYYFEKLRLFHKAILCMQCVCIAHNYLLGRYCICYTKTQNAKLRKIEKRIEIKKSKSSDGKS